MEQFISQFCSVPEKVQHMLAQSVNFKHAALEMAKTFNLRMSLNKDSAVHDSLYVNMVTPSGLPVGKFSYHRVYSRTIDMYYSMCGPIIHKEHRGLSSQDQRDAKKVTGLISAMKKNNEIPTEAAAWKSLAYYPLRYAFTTVSERGSRRPQVSADSEVITALMKLFIDGDKMSVEMHRNTIEEKYRKYQKELEELRHAKGDAGRFMNGCTAIGCVPKSQFSDSFYIVADVANDPKLGPVPHSYARYETLANSPVAADAAIIRTYAQDKEFFNADNELGLRVMDSYLPDIDVAVGFQNHQTGVWVLLPKHGA